MHKLSPTDVAWIILWIFVIICNLLLEEKLSQAVDRYLASRYRWGVEAWLALFYLHLSNRLPARIDPLAHIDTLPVLLKPIYHRGSSE